MAQKNLCDAMDSDKELCSLPWSNIDINFGTASIRPCCMYTGKFNSDELSSNFKEIWQGAKFQELRQRMLSKEKINECSACDPDHSWSYKTEKNKIFRNKGILDDISLDDPKLPTNINIGLNNTCNLQCRMCNVRSSSKLADLVNSNTFLETYLGKPESLNKDFVIPDEVFDNAEIITFVGGEPMLNKTLPDLITRVVAEAKRLKAINVTTNLTVINEYLLDVMNQYTGAITISLDGPERINSYIRHLSDWNTIRSNVKKLSTRKRIAIKVRFTMGALNVGYVTEFLDELHEIEQEANIKILRLETGLIDRPKALVPTVLPEDVKQFYLEKLNNIDTSKYTIPQSRDLINIAKNILTDTSKSDLTSFIKHVRALDQATGTRVTDVYPEFSNIFGITGSN